MTEIMSNMYDCTFKSIVLDEDLKDYICFIINNLTGIDYDELMSGEFSNTEFIIRHLDDKRRVCDVILKTKNYIINIEANLEYYEGLFIKNNSYYQSILSTLYKRGEDYLNTKKAIQINIDDFSLKDVYPKTSISKYVLKESKYNNVFIENDTEKYYVDLVTLNRICKKRKYKNLKKIEKYLLMLKVRNLKILKEIGDDEVLKKVVSKIVEMNEDEELIGVYDKEVEDAKILRTRLEGARMEGVIEGEKIGYDLGEKSGYKSGYTKGEKSGYTKGLFDTARNLIMKNINIDVISETTGLSINEIKSLDIF